MSLRTLRPERSASAIPPLRLAEEQLPRFHKQIILSSGSSVNALLAIVKLLVVSYDRHLEREVHGQRVSKRPDKLKEEVCR